MEQQTIEQQLEALQTEHKNLLNLVWLMRKQQKEFFMFRSKIVQHKAMQLENQLDILLETKLAEKKQKASEQLKLL